MSMVAILTFHADGYRPGTRHLPHQHDELHLSLVLSGRVSETVGRVTEWAQPLSVVAKDAGVRHANDFGPGGARMARLTLKAGTIAALVEDPSRAAAWRWTGSAAVARPYLNLVRRSAGTGHTFAGDDPDLVDLLAGVTARRLPEAHGSPPAWLAQTMDALRNDWHPRLSVGDVARRAGVHPVYLARCVRRWYGTGVAEELRRLRVQSAAAALAASCETVSSVAHFHGFADEAHLCREFRRASGTTPARYRNLINRVAYTWRGRT
ncbi:MAG TPA: AraC family transcriptional regulator [Gemmatimonadaceae bacterium]|nr:AraC family transcriptional regulator [Gemmatimonadaceae bacterium]